MHKIRYDKQGQKQSLNIPIPGVQTNTIDIGR